MKFSTAKFFDLFLLVKKLGSGESAMEIFIFFSRSAGSKENHLFGRLSETDLDYPWYTIYFLPTFSFHHHGKLYGVGKLLGLFLN